MARVKGPTEYNDAESKTLLDVLEQEAISLKRISWISVEKKYNEAHMKAVQEANEQVRKQTGKLGTQQPVLRRRQSLKYLYNKMRGNVVLIKGNTTPPTLAARAREIEKLVLGEKKACICELGGVSDEDHKEQILAKEEEKEQTLVKEEE